MTKRYSLLLFVLLNVSLIFCQNLRPIIGILDQPTSGDMRKYGKSYIAASYVKFIESAGARVVPISHQSSEEELRNIFNQINGIIFPGGSSDLDKSTKLFQTGKFLYQLALEANAKGDYFPIMGICMGFQFLSLITSDDNDLLTRFDSDDVSWPLQFTSDPMASRFFGSMPKEIVEIYKTQNITMNNHNWGVSLHDWYSNKNLVDFYNVLSTNKDRKGKVFISTIEAKNNIPIYGVQWHPEKVMFEWIHPSEINHSYPSIIANQLTATFFVNECRKNNHKFKSFEEEEKSLIYQHIPVYTYPINRSFQQSYFFDK